MFFAIWKFNTLLISQDIKEVFTLEIFINASSHFVKRDNVKKLILQGGSGDTQYRREVQL